MGLFKRKKKEEVKHTDFSKYKIRINAKVMCAYEAMTGRPFLEIDTADDMQHLFYCSLVLNNEDFSTMEYGVFQYLIADEEVVNWIGEEYMKIGKFLSQFKSDIGEEKEEHVDTENGEKPKTFYMLEAVSGLIVRMGMDPDYVMYRMDEWEISYYYRILNEMDKERLTEDRLWTYLTILPHVGKKLGGPEKLLPFPWEKSEKEKAKSSLEKNSAAAVAFLSRTAKKEENNG